MAKLKPVLNRILVKREEPSETKGKIVLAEASREGQTRGEVLAVGAGRYSEEGVLVPPPVNPGDVVEFAAGAGTEFEYEDEKFLLLAPSEVIGKVG